VLQGGLVMAKSGRPELGDNIYGHYRSTLNQCDVFGQQSNRIWCKTQNKGCYVVRVIEGNQGWYHSEARMRLPISD